MIINLSQKAILPLIAGGASAYRDAGTIKTPPDNCSGWSSFVIYGADGSNEVAEFGTSDYTITPSGGADVIRNITAAGIKMQPLNIAITEEVQIFTPASPIVGYSSVNVNSATKSTLFANPKEDDQEYKPYPGDYGIGSLSLSSARLQEKTITPGEQPIPVKPDSGYYGLSKVTVKGGTGLKSYTAIYYGQDNYTYSALRIPDDSFIKNPQYIIAYTLDWTRTYDVDYLIGFIAKQSDGYIYWAPNTSSFGYQYYRFDISAYNYNTTSTNNSFSFKLPIESGTTHVQRQILFRQGMPYFIGIYGT